MKQPQKINRYIDPEKEPLFRTEELKAMNVLGKRLAEARRARGMTLEDVSQQLAKYDIQAIRSAISRWENGSNIPSAYALMALCCIFELDDPVSYFSDNALFNDEGLQKIADYKSDLQATGRYSNGRHFTVVESVTMRVSTLTVSAGTGAFLDDDNFEELSVPENTVPAGAEFGIYVSGDSMEPVYHNGQIVWVKQCNQLRPGEVGIFLYDGDGYIKVYEEQAPADPDAFTDSYGNLYSQPVLISYNKKYRPIEVSADKSFQIIGRVLSLY